MERAAIKKEWEDSRPSRRFDTRTCEDFARLLVSPTASAVNESEQVAGVLSPDSVRGLFSFQMPFGLNDRHCITRKMIFCLAVTRVSNLT